MQNLISIKKIIKNNKLGIGEYGVKPSGLSIPRPEVPFALQNVSPVYGVEILTSPLLYLREI